jgi:hypothetical protein
VSDNAMVHGRYAIPRELHKRLSVEAAMQEIGIQELMCQILDGQLPPLPQR